LATFIDDKTGGCTGTVLADLPRVNTRPCKNTYETLNITIKNNVLTLKLRNVPTPNEFELLIPGATNGVLSLGSSLSVSEEYATECRSSLLP